MCHSNIFTDICRNIHNASEIFMKSIKKKYIFNISKDESNAIKSLRNNNDIVICKADKGNAIVILDKDDYTKKAEEILNLKQFKPTSKSLLNENEKKMNNYTLELHRNNVIEKQLYWRLHSTSSCLATMYDQPKVHKVIIHSDRLFLLLDLIIMNYLNISLN